MNKSTAFSRFKWSNLALPALLILIASFGRLIPHPPNFTPISSMALYGGSKMSRAWAWAIPFIALLMTDLILGFHDLMPFVYISFALIVLLGQYSRRLKQSAFNIGALTITGSTLFYLVTNFGVWASSTWYSNDLNGLLTCYLAGLPFYATMLAGDLFYVGILFGAHHWIAKQTGLELAPNSRAS